MGKQADMGKTCGKMTPQKPGFNDDVMPPNPGCCSDFSASIPKNFGLQRYQCPRMPKKSQSRSDFDTMMPSNLRFCSDFSTVMLL